ncbi:MAG: hypothetical protein QOH49_3835 [Acidobacteriota bacterium]|nr:hypothetical protein [Acidobacteriota bacterium]
MKSVCLFLAASLLALSVACVVAVLAADQFFAGDGSALNASKWGATAAGPFTSAFTAGSVANFATPNGTSTGASVTVGGFNATENFTLTSAGGTISNRSNGVVPLSVSAGKTLDFGAQVFTSSAAAGYAKNGAVVQSAATSNVFNNKSRVNAFLSLIRTSPTGAPAELKRGEFVRRLRAGWYLLSGEDHAEGEAVIVLTPLPEECRVVVCLNGPDCDPPARTDIQTAAECHRERSRVVKEIGVARREQYR